jgi:hypothetical protein
VLKKIIVLMMCVMLMLPGRLIAQESEGIQVLVNGQRVVFEQSPIIVNGSTLVPARTILEQLGLLVRWNAKTQTIVGMNHKVNIELSIGNKEAIVNGEPIQLGTAPTVVNGESFIPFRLITDILHGHIDWDETSRTITLGTTDEEALRRAILNRDEQQVHTLLADGAYANYADAQQQSMLELAMTTSLTMVSDLLKAGAETNSRNQQGDYPLHQAVRKHDIELTRMLLGAGARVDVTDANKRTPLVLAKQCSEQSVGDPIAYESLQSIRNMLSRSDIPNDQQLFPVKVNGKYGYMDRFGSTIISPNYDYAEPFYDDLAIISYVKENKHLYGFIDRKGTIVLEPQFERVAPFQSGVAPVTTFFNDQYVTKYIDKQGKQALPGTYTLASPFIEANMAIVVKSTDNRFLSGLRWGSINREGKEIIPLQYKYMPFIGIPSGEGLIAASHDGTKWGYIDKNGNERIPFDFYSAGAFKDGLAPVKVEPFRDSLFGYIDHSGKTVLEPKYKQADEFSEGLASVQLPGSEAWGFINVQGNMVIPPQFRSVGDFHQGVAEAWPLHQPRKMGYVDTRGDWVIPPVYDSVDGFENGLAKVSLGDEDNDIYIDLTGRVIWGGNPKRGANTRLAPIQ